METRNVHTQIIVPSVNNLKLDFAYVLIIIYFGEIALTINKIYFADIITFDFILQQNYYKIKIHIAKPISILI